MSIETALRTWLESDPDVRDRCQGRIYPNKRPQSATGGGGELPCVVYWQSGQSTQITLGGLSGVANPRYTIDCRGNTYNEAKSLADLIRGNKSNPKLDGFRGLVGNTGVRIQRARLVGETDEAEPPAHGEDRGGDHVALEFELWYEDI